MGQGLLRFTVFRKAMEEAEKFLGSLGCYWSIRGTQMLSLPIHMFADVEAEALFIDYQPENGYADIGHAQFSQPLCTAVQVALVDLLRSWNVKPNAVVGHSSGEIAAAYCSGSISRQAAWAISYYRGLSVWEAFRNPGHEDSGCSMTAVQLSADALSPFLSAWNYTCAENERITIACYNSPSNVTVSGPIEGLTVLESSLEQDGVPFRRLEIDVAYHSS